METNILRRFVGALFAAGVLGIGIELCFLGHTEDRWQLVPLVLLGLGLMELTREQLRLRPTSADMNEATIEARLAARIEARKAKDEAIAAAAAKQDAARAAAPAIKNPKENLNSAEKLTQTR